MNRRSVILCVLLTTINAAAVTLGQSADCAVVSYFILSKSNIISIKIQDRVCNIRSALYTAEETCGFQDKIRACMTN